MAPGVTTRESSRCIIPPRCTNINTSQSHICKDTIHINRPSLRLTSPSLIMAALYRSFARLSCSRMDTARSHPEPPAVVSPMRVALHCTGTGGMGPRFSAPIWYHTAIGSGKPFAVRCREL
uniref:Uncharacterized protein n=1 Tax=Anopheles atroparvus TaxID=41427 RepID=A0AAG5CUW3_ANOAO